MYKNLAVCVYRWPAASMKSDGAKFVVSGVYRSTASAFVSDTVSPAASKTTTITVFIFASPSADLDTGRSCVIGVQHALYSRSHPR